MQRHHSSINIGYRNINKLISKQVDKTKDDMFIRSINKSDIIGLAEVKCDIIKSNFEDFIVHTVV